ncbi:MAG TPA: hypothetical protein VME66_00955 [Candidatus Acidoferrales bacterium]|nr:hypothetical protein [Candidatus Acidoferrales bacterium]
MGPPTGPLAEIVDAGGTVVQGVLQAPSSAVPGPVLSPGPLPGAALPVAVLSYPTLAAQTTYTVEVQFTLVGGCREGVRWIHEGSFTTGG